MKRNKDTFGYRVRTARRAIDMTQAELAKRIRLEAPTVCLIERGTRSPSYETLLALADALNVSLDVLCGRKGG